MFFNWRDANQYVIYKYGRGVKYGDTESKGQSGTRDKGGTWTRMLGWDSGLRRKESGRDRIMVSVVQSGNWTRGLGRRGGTRTQPYGLRVQRRVFSTASLKDHYLGDKGNEMESLRASYFLYQLTCCVNHLYSSSLLSNIRPSLCDPSLHCVISVVYSSPSNNPGTYITDNNIRILENQCLLNYYSYA